MNSPTQTSKPPAPKPGLEPVAGLASRPVVRPALLVLAAGMGSRYGGLKQVEPVGPSGEVIIDYSIYDALRAGFGRVVFVIRRDIERPFKELVGERFGQRVAVDYVYQDLDRLPAGFTKPAGRQKPWGTGHAILAGAEAIHEPFAAINADDFYGPNSFRLLANHLTSGNGAFAMVGYLLRNTLSEFGSVARGVCQLTADGFLKGVTEMTRIEKDGAAVKHTDGAGRVHPLTGDEVVSLNLWGFTPGLFEPLRRLFITFLEERGQDEKAEFYIPAAVNSMVETGRQRVIVLRTPDSWFGVTYREDRPSVIAGIRRLIERGDYPEKLWA